MEQSSFILSWLGARAASSLSAVQQSSKLPQSWGRELLLLEPPKKRLATICQAAEARLFLQINLLEARAEFVIRNFQFGQSPGKILGNQAKVFFFFCPSLACLEKQNKIKQKLKAESEAT